MTRAVTLVVTGWLLVATPVSAQDASGSHVADVVSYLTVGANLTLDTVASFRADDRGHAFRMQALRVGTTIGISEVLKRLIHETRPDGSDNKSFPSEHAALSCVSIDLHGGKALGVQIPLAVGTGTGRIVADKHHWWDVAAGCGLGLALGVIR